MPRRYVSACRKTKRNGAALPLYKKRWLGRAAATALIGISTSPHAYSAAVNAVKRSNRKYHYTNRRIIAGRVAIPAPPQLV